MTTTDRAKVMYDLDEIVLDESRIDELRELLKDPESAWYAKRRLQAFASSGLLAASKWNPLMHPRGPDGQFIMKFGWVRWLVDGQWQRGHVTNITDAGVIVKPDNDIHHIKFDKPEKKLFSIPSPKGYLNVPDPQSSVVPTGWKKTGGQGGSNPGGKFQTQISQFPNTGYDMDAVEAMVDRTGMTEMIAKYGEEHTLIEMGGPNSVVSVISKEDGKRKVFFNIDDHKDPNFDKLTVFGEPGYDDVAYDSLRVWKADSEEAVTDSRYAGRDLLEISPDTEFYVKTTKSPEHAASEVLANDFYDLAGVPVPALFHGDNQTVASQIITGDAVTTLDAHIHHGVLDEDIAKQIREGIAVDAWLANWDVAGLSYDNIIISDGVPYRIDTGGSLQYRAQGGTKGSLFGGSVGELDSFLDSQINSSSSKVFAGITLEEKKVGAERIAAISNLQIRDMVESAGLSPSVADILIVRRSDILSKLSVADPYKGYMPPPIGSIEPKHISKQKYWNPLNRSWMDGVLTTNMTKTESDFMEFTENLPSIPGAIAAGDIVRVKHGFGERPLLYKVTSGWEGPGDPLLGVPIVDDPTGTLYQLDLNGPPDIVAVKDGLGYDSVVEGYREKYIRFEVAGINDRIAKLNTVMEVVNQGGYNSSPEPPGTGFNPRLIPFDTFDELTALDKGSFVHRNYSGEDGFTTLYQINASTDDSVSLTGIIDGKEWIVDRKTFNKDQKSSKWRVPDDFTDNLLDALLTRDGLLEDEDNGKIVFIGDGEKTSVVSELKEATPWTTTPEMKSIGVADVTAANGVNLSIPIDKPYNVSDLIHGLKTPEDNPFEKFIGKTIVVSSTDSLKTNTFGGIWFVTDVDIQKDYSGNRYPTLKLRSSGGRDVHWTMNHWSADSHAGTNIQVTSLDASVPQKLPTFKANGDILAEGVVVGTHGQSWDFTAQIFPEFSYNGEMVSLRSGKKKDLKTLVWEKVIPQSQHTTVPKSEGTKGLESAVLKASVLMNQDFDDGQWVQAPDGFIGKVIPWPTTIEKSSWKTAVRLEAEDGTVRIRNANVLGKIDGPDDTYGAPIPIIDITDSPYKGLEYKDGNTPAIGQTVKAERGKKVTVGTVTWVTPPGGKQAKITPYADIIDEDGKKWKKSLSTITLLDGKSSFEAMPGKAMAEAVTGFTPESMSDNEILHMTPDGKLLAQTQGVKDAWLSVSPKRKLTQDGYAPTVGMRVRDSQGNAYVITGFNDIHDDPNRVRLLSIPGMEEKGRVVSRLSVDHAAERSSQVDEKLSSIRFVSTPDGPVNLPNGTPIYLRQGVDVYGDSTKNHRVINEYFVITDTGRVRVISGKHEGNINPSTYLMSGHSTNSIRKVAVIDDTSPTVAAMKTVTFNEGHMGLSTAFVPYNPEEFSHEEALSGYFTDLASVKVSGVSDPVSWKSVSNALPKPSDAPEAGDTGGKIPFASGDHGDLHMKPEGLSSEETVSILGAAQKILSDKDDKGAYTGSFYAAGDSDYVEDMLIRSQIAKDVDTNQEYLELEFRMQEGKAEDAADSLLQAGKVKHGAWETVPDMTFVTDIEVGDAISVRKSSMSGFLKPSNDNKPNARIITAPELLGTDDKGTEIYRVGIASNFGDFGEVDIELRSVPTVQKYEWNPNKIIKVDSTTAVHLTQVAEKAGWTELGGIGFDRAIGDNGIAGTISMDETGAKLFTTAGVDLAAGGAGGQNSLGKRIERSFPDGSYVRFNAVPSGVSGTGAGSGSSTGQIRRWNSAGHVTIRVPVEIADDDSKLQEAIGRGMSAVGIPKEAQGPATKEQLAVFALNKVSKTYSKTFKHRSAPVKSASMNDPVVVDVLSRMDTELGKYLGRKVTLDDIQLVTLDDGRFQVMLSKEVAAAVSQSQGNKYYTHNHVLDTNGLFHVLGGPSPGLMGADERFSLGIFTARSSARSDLRGGSGNRVYMSGRTADKIGANDASGHHIIFSANAINRTTEVYVNGSDGWGKRSMTNSFLVEGGSYEYMVKRKVVPEQIAYVMVTDQTQKDELIKKFNDAGVYELHGRDLDDFFRLRSDGIILTNTDEFRDLGTEYGEIVTVGSLT